MPRCAMLCHGLPGWSRGPALPRLCQAVAVQVTGLSHAATGCELPAKQVMETTAQHSTAHPTTLPDLLLAPPGSSHLLSQGWHGVLWCISCTFCPPSLSILTVPTRAVGTAVVHAQLGFGTHSTLHLYRVPCTQGVPTHRAVSAASPCRRDHAGNAGSLGMPRRLRGALGLQPLWVSAVPTKALKPC